MPFRSFPFLLFSLLISSRYRIHFLRPFTSWDHSLPETIQEKSANAILGWIRCSMLQTAYRVANRGGICLCNYLQIQQHCARSFTLHWFYWSSDTTWQSALNFKCFMAIPTHKGTNWSHPFPFRSMKSVRCASQSRVLYMERLKLRQECDQSKMIGRDLRYDNLVIPMSFQSCSDPGIPKLPDGIWERMEPSKRC